MITDESLQEKYTQAQQTIAELSSKLNKAEQEITKLRKLDVYKDEIIERQKAIVQDANHWKEECKRLENEAYQQLKIRRAPVLKPVAKAVLEESLHVQKWGTVKDPEGYTRANFTTIAKNLNTSPETVARQAEQMKKLGLIDIREYQGPKDERDRKYIHVNDERLATIETLEDPEQVIPKQGGNRYSCQKCGSINVAKRTVTYVKCLEPECGHETILKDTGYIVQNEQETQKQHAFEDETSETSFAGMDSEEQDGQNTQKQHAFEESETIDPSQKQNAEHLVRASSTPPTHNTDTTQADNKAAQPANYTVVTEEQQHGDHKEAAIQFLLDIAGDAVSVIKMNKNWDGISDQGKYYHEKVEVDGEQQPVAFERKHAIAHMNGLKTYGTLLRQTQASANAPLTSKALQFDADNEQQCQICIEAAPVLAEHGIPSTWEPSPTKAGNHTVSGRLWFVFDEKVNRDVARMAILAICPQLADIQECFPYGNQCTRLPAGRYVRKGLAEWCDLYDEAGNCLGHGWEGIEALAQRLTPAHLIKKYTPEQPFTLKSEQAPTGQGGATCKNTVQEKMRASNAPASMAKIVAEEFNATTTDDDIVAMCGGWKPGGYFYCAWRGDKGRPNATISAKTHLITDWARFDERGKNERMDKYEVWCRLEAMRLGIEDWQTFKRQDIKRRWAARQDKAA